MLRRDLAWPLRLALGMLVAGWLGVGCAQAPPPAGNDLLMPLTLRVPWLPEPSDKAASRLAAIALASKRFELLPALAVVENADDSHVTEDLVPLCTDLVNSAQDDEAEYRKDSKELRQGWGTDPALEARLDRAIEDDPLKIARRRRRDTWEVLWARTFNAVSEPLGRAITSGFILAPLTISSATVHYLASFSNDEALSLTDRQALKLRKEYLAHNPNADDAQKIQDKVDYAEKKLDKTMRKRRLRQAIAAAKAGASRTAQIEAERALFWGPSRRAEKIRDQAIQDIAQEHELRAASLVATRRRMPELNDPETRALLVELLETSSTAAPLGEATLTRLLQQKSGNRGDEARYIVAMTQHESGYEVESWANLARLGAKSPGDSYMSRHARALIGDPWQDPYEAFKRMKSKKSHQLAMWRAFGKWSRQTRYPNLPKPIALLIDAPSIAQTLATSPLRLIFGKWQKDPDFQQPTAVLGYRYLGVHPAGEHSREVMDWLYEYEKQRGNTVAALRMADFIVGFDPDQRRDLAEQASTQTLEAAARLSRPDRRTALLRQAVKEYPDTESGLVAGQRVRAELEYGSPQKISVTRSFLVENPRVAGRGGLGINPLLVNGRIEDGELHASGITFAGGRRIRIDLVPESGDEDDEPESVYRTISKERLSRMASMLDETVRRNELIDSDDRLPPDADRDRFIERARLGLVDTPDMRPTAQSTFVYQSMRERYGMVRGRESILPFDLVLRGSFSDLSLGAFPRWRPPKQTPDAFLYR